MLDRTLPQILGRWPKCDLFTIMFQDGQLTVKASQLAKEEVDGFRSEHTNIFTLLDPGYDLTGASYLASIVVFDFVEPLLSQFGKIADSCHKEESISAIEKLDEAMARDTGLSALQTSLLLEILASIATSAENWPLLRDLVAKGPPTPRPDPVPAEDRDRQYFIVRLHGDRSSAGAGDWALLSHLVSTGWRNPVNYIAGVWDIMSQWGRRGGNNASTSGTETDTGAAEKAAQAQADKDATQLLDAFFAVGYLPDFKNDRINRDRRLRWFTNAIKAGASAALLRDLAARGLRPRDVPKASVLVHVVTEGYTEVRPGPPRSADETRQLLAFLIDEQGLDMNAPEWSHDQVAPCLVPQGPSAPLSSRVSYERTAMHAAVETANVAALQYLLERGAKIRKDGVGRTPFERAVMLDKFEAVRCFTDFFQEKGRTFSYVDEWEGKNLM